MIDSTLTKLSPNSTKTNDQPSISSFLEASPSGYGIFDEQRNELSYYNDAFLNLFHCEPFALNKSFPNPRLLRIQERNFTDQWNNCLKQVDRKGRASLDCTIQSSYGEKVILNLTLWKIPSPNNPLIGVKLEDVTTLKKLKSDANSYVKII